MSDSDSDYCDVGTINTIEAVEVSSSESGAVNSKNGKRVRGKDIQWYEFCIFDSTDDFKKSELSVSLTSDFTKKFSRENIHADTETFICKFARRRGYLPCPLKFKVNFFSTSELVLVETNLVHPAHNHVANADHDTEGSAFRWTREQTEMIRQGVANEAKPKVIRRNMENANLFSGGRVPTSLELNNKIAHVRKQLHGSSQIFDTHKLREKINEFSEIPDDDLTGYIVSSEVHDEDEDADPRFNIIWTSKKADEPNQ